MSRAMVSKFTCRRERVGRSQEQHSGCAQGILDHLRGCPGSLSSNFHVAPSKMCIQTVVVCAIQVERPKRGPSPLSAQQLRNLQAYLQCKGRYHSDNKESLVSALVNVVGHQA